MPTLTNEVQRTRYLKGQGGGAIYCGRDFSPAEQAESEMYGFDFVNDLEEGETLSSATWSIIVLQGVDGTPTSHLVGSPALFTPDGTTVQSGTEQRISGLLQDVTYGVRAQAVTSAGNTKALWSHIRGVNIA